jgi:uncharacterized protein YbaR (Trm112 family)
MHVELIDLLRCPRPHEDAWLVAAAYATAERHVVRGTLGCPVCKAEYPVHDGVADFGAAPDAATAPDPEWDEDMALRVAALLDLGAPGGTIVLGGAWQRVGATVAELTGVRVLLLDPPRAEPLREEVSAVRGGGTIPVAGAGVRGVALDGHTADAERLAAAARALRPRGRLVAPASGSVPDGVTEVARDDTLWVAERDAASTSRPVALQRR